MKLHTLLLSAGLLSLTGVAQAALHDRGGGLIYDDVLDVTWLQDANLAATDTFGLPYDTDLGDHPSDFIAGYSEIIHIDGSMNWGAALHWIDAMNAKNYLGYSDWRLPQTLPVNGIGYVLGVSLGGGVSMSTYDGSTDLGWNISAPGSVSPGSTASQLAYMYHNNLENLSLMHVSGLYVQPGWGLANSDPFQNVQPGRYWSGNQLVLGISRLPWAFNMEDGYQGWASGTETLYAWAVRDGDVAASVPEPETYALMLAGLGLVGWTARRRA